MKPFLPVVFCVAGLVLSVTSSGLASEYHVAVTGEDGARGTRSAPLRTIQRAAELAQAGDVITVHAGVYRERINPPRGGESNRRRIVYQAAKGEKVEIRGSEVVKGWERHQGEVWKVTVANQLFGTFNPYADVIRGDWFTGKGRVHHTGAVYLDGVWLTEATSLEDLLLPPGVAPAWMGGGKGETLLNVAWLRPGNGAGDAGRTGAAAYAAQEGVQKAPCSEGGECIGWIEAGDWVKYASVDFGSGAEELEMRVASATGGGVIEVRLDEAGGELLGRAEVKHTGGWQNWESVKAKVRRVSGAKVICLVFRGRVPAAVNPQMWHAKVEEGSTTIWAQFPGVNPNERLVEINVRKTVFYPDQPGRNYLTVRGFGLRHAATPWAPPTAEQVGLIGTHWSKGWVIEDNEVSHSVCSGIALGKHGDEFDNTSADTAEGYVKTIERALARGWSKEKIGHHVVRRNTITHCEQAGVVGSLGAAFSTVTDNVIHDIHVRQLFTGAEMAGIKFHAAIDSVIARNHIYRTCRGLWLDWMAQGTRVTQNLFHENGSEDLFMEVNHGPFMVDNNLFLSRTSLLDVSEGGAYAHNLFKGRIQSSPELGRETPWHPAHVTPMAGLVNVKGGDNRFYNNVFVGTGKEEDSTKDPSWGGGHGLWMYNFREHKIQAGGNVYVNGARPSAQDQGASVVGVSEAGSAASIATGSAGRFELGYGPGSGLEQAGTVVVTTEMLGRARVPDLGYENADGSPLKITLDFLGNKRDGRKPMAGPLEKPEAGTLGVWATRGGER